MQSARVHGNVPEVHLYHLTLQRPMGITHAIQGSFSAPKTQEIVVARGTVLELLRLQDDVLQSIYATEIFGLVRSLMAFRFTGGTRDFIVVGSDSGRIAILEFDANRNCFEKVHLETYGKTGCRRIVPGQYLAMDPRGRAVMIGAAEKQKLAYILNRDSDARVTISSPLEANKNHILCQDIVGIDVGFENPQFAAIELDYEEIDEDSTGRAFEQAEKVLTTYELDLGINSIIRKYAEPIPVSAHNLVSVPGGSDGPGGVLILCQNFIVYMKHEHESVSVMIPRRKDFPLDRDIMIVSSTMLRARASAKSKQPGALFYLLQSEIGDIYKLSFVLRDGEVEDMDIRYFDTIPTSTALCLFRSGYLFSASEFGNHKLYVVQSAGSDDEEQEIIEVGDSRVAVFDPHPLQHLALLDDFNSLSPITDFLAEDLLNEGNAQIYCGCGRGVNSSLRVLRHGLSVGEIAVTNFPHVPSAIWSVKKSLRDVYDSYIVVSYKNATVVHEVGEDVHELTNSSFFVENPTLLVTTLANDSIMQIHTSGVRLIRPDTTTDEWMPPQRKTITKATANERQVVIALAGGEVIYFELDDTTKQLTEVEKVDMEQEVACLDVGPVPEGRQRCRFLAVGTYDDAVRILSLDPDDCLQIIARQALTASPESLAINAMEGPSRVGKTGGPSSSSSASRVSSLYLFVGLSNGVLLRTVMDSVTGEMSDSRTRFLGAAPVRLCKVVVQNSQAVMALSSRSWLCYDFQQQYHITPLSYEPLSYASSLTSAPCPDGFVAISGSSLRVFFIERLGEAFNQTVIPLKCTPRKMIVNPNTSFITIIETEHRAYTDTEKMPEELLGSSGGNDMEIDDEETSLEQQRLRQEHVAEREARERELGLITAPNGKWASYVRVFSPTENRTLDLIELQDNEAAFSLTTCDFQGEYFLAVGTGQNVDLLADRKCSCGFIHIYRLIEGFKLELVHKTMVEDIPYALAPFQGRLLAGIGKCLRMYDLGKKRLLKKCESRMFPCCITSIHSFHDRIYVSDGTDSFHFCLYSRVDNTISIFADDVAPRWVTSSILIDPETLAGADKFGNVFISRLDKEVAERASQETGARYIWERGYLNGAPSRCDEAMQFHVGDVVTRLRKASLVPGGLEAILYSTVLGGIGAFVPFETFEEVDFFLALEMQLRRENPPLCGQDHMRFRSFYFPVKACVDGDLCEQYSKMELSKQTSIAENLERTPSEIGKKLEDFRNHLL